MRAWLASHRAALTDAVRRLLSAPLASLLSVAAIGTALSLPLVLHLAIQHAGGMARHISREPAVTVFMAADAGRDDARALDARLQAHPQVAKVEYMPRDAALDILQRSAGLGDVRETLGHNPLPDAFVVSVRGAAPATIEALRKELSAWPRVEHVQAEAQWAQRLHALLRVGRSAVLIGAVLLGALLAAITFNTIRLQILARKEEIEVSKLIGATDAFVRRPFVYFGVLQGLLGGAFALLVAGSALWTINREVRALAVLYGASFEVAGPGPSECLAVLAGAALLAAAGSWASSRKYLRELEVNSR
jgi:cell division transport system permease protein